MRRPIDYPRQRSGGDQHIRVGAGRTDRDIVHADQPNATRFGHASCSMLPQRSGDNDIRVFTDVEGVTVQHCCIVVDHLTERLGECRGVAGCQISLPFRGRQEFLSVRPHCARLNSGPLAEINEIRR